MLDEAERQETLPLRHFGKFSQHLANVLQEDCGCDAGFGDI